MANRRLIECLDENRHKLQNGVFLDCYNGRVAGGAAPTITAHNIIASNLFIYEEQKDETLY